MYRKMILLLALVATQALYADEMESRLERADAYRQNAESVVVDISVEQYKGDELEKQRQYRVYSSAGRRSLVVSQSAVELGQKILMHGDSFHLFLPNTRRAIRITPMQKLLGEASTGDVASMTWHEDYTARLLKAEELYQGRKCRVLELTSRRKGTTYGRIELYLEHNSDAPLYARLFLASGKLAKEAVYQLGEMAGRRMVVGMTLVDRIKSGRHTRITYHSIKAQRIPARYFNPQYLSRNLVQ